MSAGNGILAIDVGSSRVKLGWFPPEGECATEPKAGTLPIAAPQLPTPSETLSVSHADTADLWSQVGEWLTRLDAAEPRRFVASVHPAKLSLIQEMFAHGLRALTADDLPIAMRVDQPERVGIDRLLNAVAVNRMRQTDRAAIVVDLGTACTVDLIAADGAYEGGAILPGPTLAAAALHTGTATLPQLEMDFDNAPSVLGKSTQAAISSGIYWGMVGAVRELIHRMSHECEQTPQLFLTGGGALQLVTHLANDFKSLRHIPHLVLSGIALVAEDINGEEMS